MNAKIWVLALVVALVPAAFAQAGKPCLVDTNIVERPIANLQDLMDLQRQKLHFVALIKTCIEDSQDVSHDQAEFAINVIREETDRKSAEIRKEIDALDNDRVGIVSDPGFEFLRSLEERKLRELTETTRLDIFRLSKYL